MHAKVKFYAVFGEDGESLGNYFSELEAKAALADYFLKRRPYEATLLQLHCDVEAEEA